MRKINRQKHKKSMKLKISNKQLFTGLWLFLFVSLLLGQILVSLRIAGIEPAKVVKPEQRNGEV